MSERKLAQIVTRMGEADRDRLKQEAERDGCDISTFVRMTLRREFQARERRQQPVAA